MSDFSHCRNLAAWLAAQEQNHPKDWDLGLERITAVWQNLGAPALADYIISIAGTNGKGSCVSWAEAIAAAAGIDIASFSSPHLLDYPERIRFGGQNVAEEDLCRAFARIDAAREGVSLSFFEWSALAAFVLMAEHKPQLAVLEVGLGGRLDAVNIQNADATIFSRIGLDHQQWLGESVGEIAMEKAGIMRQGQRITIAYPDPPANFLQHAESLSERVWLQGRDFSFTANDGQVELKLPNLGTVLIDPPRYMHGEHQLGHLAAVAATIGEAFPLGAEQINIASKTAHNFARLTWLEEFVLIDVAHNQDSAAVLNKFLQEDEKLRKIRSRGGKIVAICAMLKDKDQEAFFAQFSPASLDFWILTATTGKRGLSSEELALKFKQSPLAESKFCTAPDIDAAIACGREILQEGDVLLVTGSFLTVEAFLRRR